MRVSEAKYAKSGGDHLGRGLQVGEHAARNEEDREGYPDQPARKFLMERDEQDGRKEEQHAQRVCIQAGVHQVDDVDRTRPACLPFG